jgi:hypothetical protein
MPKYPYVIEPGELLVHPALAGVDRAAIHAVVMNHATGDSGRTPEAVYFHACRQGLPVVSHHSLPGFPDVAVCTPQGRTLTIIKPLEAAWV